LESLKLERGAVMGYFLQKSVTLEFLPEGAIVDGLPIDASSGIAKTNSDLFYKTGNKNILVRKGYITDGYSKTIEFKLFGKEFKLPILEALVGGRFEDDPRPAVIHDYICQLHGYYDAYSEGFCPLAFDEANDIFLEAMQDVGINPFKRFIMRKAVNFNPNKW
jgi:hypothetical protein